MPGLHDHALLSRRWHALLDRVRVERPSAGGGRAAPDRLIETAPAAAGRTSRCASGCTGRSASARRRRCGCSCRRPPRLSAGPSARTPRSHWSCSGCSPASSSSCRHDRGCGEPRWMRGWCCARFRSPRMSSGGRLGASWRAAFHARWFRSLSTRATATSSKPRVTTTKEQQTWREPALAGAGCRGAVADLREPTVEPLKAFIFESQQSMLLDSGLVGRCSLGGQLEAVSAAVGRSASRICVLFPRLAFAVALIRVRHVVHSPTSSELVQVTARFVASSHRKPR